MTRDVRDINMISGIPVVLYQIELQACEILKRPCEPHEAIFSAADRIRSRPGRIQDIFIVRCFIMQLVVCNTNIGDFVPLSLSLSCYANSELFDIRYGGKEELRSKDPARLQRCCCLRRLSGRHINRP